MKPTPYRTVFTVVTLAFFVLVALGTCLYVGGEEAKEMFKTAAFVLFLLSLPQTAKSSIEHLARGGGVKGAIAALMTSAKPEQRPEVAK